MTRILFLISLLTCFFNLSIIAQEHQKQHSEYVLQSSKNTITILVNDQEFPWKIGQDTIGIGDGKATYDIGFLTDSDTLMRTIKPSEQIHLTFIVNKNDTIRALIKGNPKPAPPAQFDSRYIQKNTGKYRVYMPEVHELVNIAVALTDIGRKDSNMVNMKTDYYDKVIDHFLSYQDHPLIKKLNQHIIEVRGNSTYSYYYNIRMNANMYTFDENQITNNSPYQRMGFGTTNELKALIPLLEDFASQSNFRSFYAENKNYYDSLIDDYYQLVPINKMWDWLEERFPQRYDSYKIYFSPLVGGAHSTLKASDNGFNETLMFIDAPIFRGEYSTKEKEAMLSRTVFTEIDHNYVNPTSDTFPEINKLMQPMSCWRATDQSTSYANSYQVFNEYMTWALFSFYLYEHFDKEIFEQRNKKEADFMAEGRGFLQFPEFNDFALSWYKNNPEKPLKEFYPKAIEWIIKYPCK